MSDTRTQAAEIRATAESYSNTDNPKVRALCEAAVFHASRAADRARHEPAFATVHLGLAAEAVQAVIEAVEG